MPSLIRRARACSPKPFGLGLFPLRAAEQAAGRPEAGRPMIMIINGIDSTNLIIIMITTIYHNDDDKCNDNYNVN